MQKYKLVEGDDENRVSIVDMEFTTSFAALSAIKALSGFYDRGGCAAVVSEKDAPAVFHLRVYDKKLKQIDYYLIKQPA